jgi:hypothetical protein
MLPGIDKATTRFTSAVVGSLLSGAALTWQHFLNFFRCRKDRDRFFPVSHSSFSIAELNPDCPLGQNYVIPAKAGIQLINKFPRKWDNTLILSASRSLFIAGYRPAPV